MSRQSPVLVITINCRAPGGLPAQDKEKLIELVMDAAGEEFLDCLAKGSHDDKNSVVLQVFGIDQVDFVAGAVNRFKHQLGALLPARMTGPFHNKESNYRITWYYSTVMPFFL